MKIKYLLFSLLLISCELINANGEPIDEPEEEIVTPSSGAS